MKNDEDTFIWFFMEEKLPSGSSDYNYDQKVKVENPGFIPRVGEFVDANGIGGYVKFVQYTYPISNQFKCCVNIMLSEDKPI